MLLFAPSKDNPDSEPDAERNPGLKAAASSSSRPVAAFSAGDDEIIMSIATTEQTNTRKLPVIDVSGLRGDSGDRRAVAREMRAACTASGFFYIKGHGVPGTLVDQVFHQSHEFFALPMEQKLALTMAQSRCRHGYKPLKTQTLEPGAPPDLKEGFLAGEDFAADHPVVRNDPANIGPNQWPPQLPQFRTAMVAYVEE